MMLYIVDTDAGAAAVEVDPFDLMDPVDILSKLPKDFFEKIVSYYEGSY